MSSSLSNERQNEIAMNRGSTLRWAWDLQIHGQIWLLSNVIRQVFLIIIRFCDFLTWFTLVQALVRGLESIPEGDTQKQLIAKNCVLCCNF